MNPTEGDTVEVTYENASGREKTLSGEVVVDPFTHRSTPDGATDFKAVNSKGQSYTVRMTEGGRIKGLHHATRRHDTRLGRAVRFTVEVSA